MKNLTKRKMSDAIRILEEALLLQAAKVRTRTTSSFSGDVEQAVADLSEIITQIERLKTLNK